MLNELIISTTISFAISGLFALILGAISKIMIKESKKPDSELKDELRESTNGRDHDFQKKLASLQITATAIATISSIMIALGISLILTSLDLSLEAMGEYGEKSKLLNIIGGGYQIQGAAMFFSGLIILLAGLGSVRKKIKELKD